MSKLVVLSGSLSRSLHLRPSTSTFVCSVRCETTTSTRHQSTAAVIPPLTAQFPVAEKVESKSQKVIGHFAMIDDSAHLQEKKPLVVMLGWGGCNDKQLAKAGQVWLDQGYGLVRYSAPMGEVTSLRDYPKYAKSLYSAISQNLQGRQILLHIFSMNGINVFLKMFNLLDKTSEGKKVMSSIKGVIFDSAPADVPPVPTAMAFAMTIYPPYPNEDLVNKYSRNLLYTYYLAKYYGQRLNVYLRSLMGQDAYAEWFGFYGISKVKHILPAKQMYFYSTKDYVCNAKVIEKFIDMQPEEAEVKKFKFTDSHHVMHFRKHAELYQNECKKFAEEAFKQ
ncbi:unnamed protein product [Bursaphelenchus okinawaensis]|uniref:DUF829 domain-containing protein n=1 Tax=Bursaphelenchus okinawaensis TaxID=465554 RepID=A0A811KSD4_9BILA|nr:unnamed protein product [Bursaphelenchus okinawaensis]CAG9111367.1 unnamed protein product [Bursaphelenchus okinawaensis]